MKTLYITVLAVALTACGKQAEPVAQAPAQKLPAHIQQQLDEYNAEQAQAEQERQRQAQAQAQDSGPGLGTAIAAGVAGAAVGAIAGSMLSSNNRQTHTNTVYVERDRGSYSQQAPAPSPSQSSMIGQNVKPSSSFVPSSKAEPVAKTTQVIPKQAVPVTAASSYKGPTGYSSVTQSYKPPVPKTSSSAYSIAPTPAKPSYSSSYSYSSKPSYSSGSSYSQRSSYSSSSSSSKSKR